MDFFQVQLVDNLQQAIKVDNLQQVCSVFWLCRYRVIGATGAEVLLRKQGGGSTGAAKLPFLQNLVHYFYTDKCFQAIVENKSVATCQQIYCQAVSISCNKSANDKLQQARF